MRQIPYGRQSINEQDVASVLDVLRSDWLTQGPAVPRFEKQLASHCDACFGVAVSNATAALHLACLALGLGPGDRLWTSPNTFVASANCALYCGAQVDFVDIDPRTYNMSVDALSEKLAAAARHDRLPKIVVPVHFAGQSCEMERIHELAQRYGFRIIEDASHAVGGRYQGLPVGNCRYSDITVFSFHPVKIITTGEGGMALTNDPALAEALSRLRSHGVTRDESLLTRPADGPWYYEQFALGFNCRMTDLQAALGASQLARLNAFVAARHAIQERYEVGLAGLPVIRPWQHPDAYSSFHLYVIQLAVGTRPRRQVFDALRSAGIGVNVHYIPVHTQPYYARLGFGWGDFPNAEAYYQNAISLPMYPDLTHEDQQFVLDTLSRSLG